jgi:hypothetical protein
MTSQMFGTPWENFGEGDQQHEQVLSQYSQSMAPPTSDSPFELELLSGAARAPTPRQ